MNAPQVRSATVRLNAEVARYIADVRRAGKETDDAFGRANAAVGRFNDNIAVTNTRMREYRTRSAQAARDTDKLAASMAKMSTSSRAANLVLQSVARDTTRLGTSMGRTGNAIDRTSGRLALFAKLGASIGPGLIPAGAVGVAGIAGLASQLGFAATGITSLVVASQGLGDALKAVEKARLEPTVENLRAAREALEGLDPAAQQFVARLQELRPVFTDIRDQGAAGWFPGLTEALDHFETVAPRVGAIFRAVGETGGSLVVEAAEALAGPEWADFLSFVEREAPAALEDLGRTAGNVVHGLSELWEAFSPVNSDFSDWLVDMSAKFDDWAANLSQTEGFEEFVAYLRENGPKVADATVAISNAILQIVQAAAPLGGPVLEAITGIAKAIAAIADSPLGTPIMAAVTAMTALSLASSAATAAVVRLNAAMAALGVTSARTGAATTAAIGAGGARGAAAGGLGVAASQPAILGAILALNSFKELYQNTTALFERDMPLWEFGVRGLVPAIGHLETLGVSIPGLSDASREASPFIGRLVHETLAAQEGLAGFATEAESARSGVSELGPVMRRVEVAMRDQERQSERSRARMAEYRAELRANREAAQQAAAGFVDFGRSAKASEFTLDGWLGKLENQTAAMRRFRLNAEQAGRRGLDEGLIQHLREMGREGAVQLDRLANASDRTIDRANANWRAYTRELRLAGQEIDTTQRALNRFGNTDAKARIGQEGAEDTAAAAARARAAVMRIPETWQTDIREKGAAAVAAAAARARAAVTSIPQSWSTTITVNRVGDALWSSGGYTGPGRKDEPAGIVHRGEVVIPQELVRRDWPMLKSRYGHLPGFESGGRVGGPPTVLTRSDAASEGGRELRLETSLRKRLNAQLKESEKVVEKERRQRDDLVNRMKEIGQGIRTGLTTDLGANNADVWSSGGGFAGDLAALRGDRTRGRRWRRLVKVLEDKGFDGPALADLLSRGDINEVADYASQSRRALRRFEQEFAERNQVLRVASRDGADAALGDRLDESNRRLRRLEQLAREANRQRKQGNRDRKDEHGKDRNALRRGAGDAARNWRRNP